MPCKGTRLQSCGEGQEGTAARPAPLSCLQFLAQLPSLSQAARLDDHILRGRTTGSMEAPPDTTYTRLGSAGQRQRKTESNVEIDGSVRKKARKQSGQGSTSRAQTLSKCSGSVVRSARTQAPPRNARRQLPARAAEVKVAGS